VTFNADHSYQASIEGSTDGSYHFEWSCLGVYDAQDCSAFASTLQLMLPPNYMGLSCTADDDGCDCSYRYLAVFGDDGTWNISDATLTLNSSLQGPPQTADFCAGASSLQIGALDGALFNSELQSIWLTKDIDASP